MASEPRHCWSCQRKLENGRGATAIGLTRFNGLPWNLGVNIVDKESPPGLSEEMSRRIRPWLATRLESGLWPREFRLSAYGHATASVDSSVNPAAGKPTSSQQVRIGWSATGPGNKPWLVPVILIACGGFLYLESIHSSRYTPARNGRSIRPFTCTTRHVW